MNDCHLVYVLGFERSRNQSNVDEPRTTRKSKVVIDPRERIGRANRSKAWKQAIVGEKFIYHNNNLHIGDKQ